MQCMSMSLTLFNNLFNHQKNHNIHLYIHIKFNKHLLNNLFLHTLNKLIMMVNQSFLLIILKNMFHQDTIYINNFLMTYMFLQDIYINFQKINYKILYYHTKHIKIYLNLVLKVQKMIHYIKNKQFLNHNYFQVIFNSFHIQYIVLFKVNHKYIQENIYINIMKLYILNIHYCKFNHLKKIVISYRKCNLFKNKNVVNIQKNHFNQLFYNR